MTMCYGVGNNHYMPTGIFAQLQVFERGDQVGAGRLGNEDTLMGLWSICHTPVVFNFI